MILPRTLDKVPPLFTVRGKGRENAQGQGSEIERGLHPNEVVVAVTTADGSREELIVDKRSLRNDTLRIGYPVGSDEKKGLLVELPRETLRGISRVWVRGDSLTREEAAA